MIIFFFVFVFFFVFIKFFVFPCIIQLGTRISPNSQSFLLIFFEQHPKRQSDATWVADSAQFVGLLHEIVCLLRVLHLCKLGSDDDLGLREVGPQADRFIGDYLRSLPLLEIQVDGCLQGQDPKLIHVETILFNWYFALGVEQQFVGLFFVILLFRIDLETIVNQTDIVVKCFILQNVCIFVKFLQKVTLAIGVEVRMADVYFS